MKLFFTAALAILLASCASMQPTASKSPIRFVGIGDHLEITVKNIYNRPICISRGAFYESSLSLKSHGETYIGLNSIQVRLAPGCDVILPRQEMSSTYDLKTVFPEKPLSDGLICFTFWWLYEDEVRSQNDYPQYDHQDEKCKTLN